MRRLYQRGDPSRIHPGLQEWVEVIPGQLDVATSPAAMRMPHYRLHQLKGELRGYWSVTVNANWRIIFRFENEDFCEVELIDYH